MRICSFLPSGTEIVYALGLGDSLYAVSHECDYPEDALAKPKIVRSRFDADKLSSQEIDRLVTEMYQRGERIYEVDEDVLREAAPDLVLTQELCDVCAVSYEDVRHAASRLAYPPNVVSRWIRRQSGTCWKTFRWWATCAACPMPRRVHLRAE